MAPFLGFSLLACSPSINENLETDRKPVQVAPSDVTTVDVTTLPQDLLSRLREGQLYNQGKDYAAIFVANSDLASIESLSNDLWSGNNSAVRSREASAKIAAESFKKSPQNWSALRSGIGFLNFDKDSVKAIQRLSYEGLSENATAAYFIALAFERSGDIAAQRVALKRAVELGHPAAQAALDALP